MGANAVFQIRPWKQRKKIGYLRMLYGKIVFKTKSLLKKKRKFKFKTATATIGVKGTEAEVQVSANANLQILSLEGEPMAQSNIGDTLVVPVNKISFSIGGREITAPIVAALYTSPSPDLDMVDPGSPSSTNLSGGGGVEDAGIDQSDYESSKEETVEADDSFAEGSLDVPEDEDVDIPTDEESQDLAQADDMEAEVLEPTIAAGGQGAGTDPNLGASDIDIENIVTIDNDVDKARQQNQIEIGRLKPIF